VFFLLCFVLFVLFFVVCIVFCVFCSRTYLLTCLSVLAPSDNWIVPNNNNNNNNNLSDSVYLHVCECVWGNVYVSLFCVWPAFTQWMYCSPPRLILLIALIYDDNIKIHIKKLVLIYTYFFNTTQSKAEFSD
jgi:hypothetical protein